MLKDNTCCPGCWVPPVPKLGKFSLPAGPLSVASTTLDHFKLLSNLCSVNRNTLNWFCFFLSKPTSSILSHGVHKAQIISSHVWRDVSIGRKLPAIHLFYIKCTHKHPLSGFTMPSCNQQLKLKIGKTEMTWVGKRRHAQEKPRYHLPLTRASVPRLLSWPT